MPDEKKIEVSSLPVVAKQKQIPEKLDPHNEQESLAMNENQKNLTQSEFIERMDIELDTIKTKFENGLISKEEAKKLSEEVTNKKLQQSQEKPSSDTMIENVADSMGIKDKNTAINE